MNRYPALINYKAKQLVARVFVKSRLLLITNGKIYYENFMKLGELKKLFVRWEWKL